MLVHCSTAVMEGRLCFAKSLIMVTNGDKQLSPSIHLLMSLPDHRLSNHSRCILETSKVFLDLLNLKWFVKFVIPA